MIRDLFGKRVGTPISGINDPNTPLYQALVNFTSGGGGIARAGVAVTQESALRVMAVLACVRLIAETIAALPLKTYTGYGDVRQEVKSPTESYIWGEPNPDQTKQTFWEQALTSGLMDGNAFLYTPRTQAGTLAEMHVQDPTRFDINRTKAGEIVYEQVNGPTYTRTEMVHIPSFTLPGRLRGLSPIGAAREAIGLSLAAEEFGARLFGNGTLLGGVIETEADLSKDNGAAAKQLKARWAQTSGLQSAHEVTVLDNGGKFKQLGIPPEDAQFIETRRFQLAEIARLYRVPPHMIADVERSTSWGSGLEEQNIGFITYTLLSWIRRYEQAITKYLLPRQTRYAQFSLDGLLRGNTTSRIAYYNAGRNGGWLSVNDIRRLEDMPPIEGGDVYQVPLNSSLSDPTPSDQGGTDGGTGTG